MNNGSAHRKLAAMSVVAMAIAVIGCPCRTMSADLSADRLPGAGTIEGVITFRGEVPKSSVPDDAGVRRDLLQVDHSTRGLANVAVWIEMDASAPAEKDSQPTAPAMMDQRDHEFVPRVLAVRSGQLVKFRNSDAAAPAACSTSIGNAPRVRA